MVHYPPTRLPTAEELPYSDDTPVDSELQDLVTHLLRTTLATIWAERHDWFFGINMGVYYHPEKPAIVPDGFLSLGVQRILGERLRLSYLLWAENYIPPILTLEVVSKTPGGEYKRKKREYARMGVLYYVIYAPDRRRKPPLEVYKLQNNTYEQPELVPFGSPLWLPEINLGIGRERGMYQGIEREWLYWYDEEGNRYLTPEEKAKEAQLEANKRAEEAQLEANKRVEEAQLEANKRVGEAQLEMQNLIAKLRQQGLTPEQLKALGIDD
jgi:Uma2 family endonuclease